jgi:Ca2+/H+ antiporter
VNRQAQAVVMLLLGGAVLKASFTDLYLRYVREGLRPFLIGAGILLVTAAIMTLWYDIRHGSAVDTECADADHDHEHGDAPAHREPRIGWLLIAPVLGLLLVAPPALGAYSAGQSGSALGSGRTGDFPPLPAGDPAEISVLDYATRAVYDR